MSTENKTDNKTQKQESTEEKEETMTTQEIANIVAALTAMKFKSKADDLFVQRSRIFSKERATGSYFTHGLSTTTATSCYFWETSISESMSEDCYFLWRCQVMTFGNMRYYVYE